MPITGQNLYTFLKGPGVVISLTIFFTGAAFNIYRLISVTKKTGRIIVEPSSAVYSADYADKGFTTRIRLMLRHSLFSTSPVTGIISMVFHILLLSVPLTLTAHNIIADIETGLSFITIPEPVSDFFTMVIILSCLFFFLRRLTDRTVRAISSFRDYFLILLVTVPFMSGLFAYHHIFNYKFMVYLHMISAETAIILFPFTGLMHIPFTLFSRFFINSEQSLVSGSRNW